LSLIAGFLSSRGVSEAETGTVNLREREQSVPQFVAFKRRCEAQVSAGNESWTRVFVELDDPDIAGVEKRQGGGQSQIQPIPPAEISECPAANSPRGWKAVRKCARMTKVSTGQRFTELVSESGRLHSRLPDDTSCRASCHSTSAI